jgi:hypothetical protein
MRHFVADHGAQPGLVARVRENSGVDGNFAARQTEGIGGLRIVDDGEFPLVLGLGSDCGNVSADALDGLGVCASWVIFSWSAPP